MKFPGDPRRRSIALLAFGVLLVFALLGALGWFNTSQVTFLNPETSGETLVFTALTVLVFHPQALCRPKQQCAGSAPAHTHGVGRGFNRPHPGGLHVPVQFSVDEPIHRPMVLAQHF
jgi:hypothetical protein